MRSWKSRHRRTAKSKCCAENTMRVKYKGDCGDMMGLKDLEILRQHKPALIGMDQCRKAAVCIPLIETAAGYDLLFEVRSASIDSQPGDICFPGGMAEDGESMQETALRELGEELLISPPQVELIGLMDVLGGSRLYVYPYAVLLREYRSTFNADEAESVFRVPLSFFLEQEPEIYHTTMKVVPEEGFPYDRIYGGRDYAWRERREDILFYQYGEYTIWGMTARIARSFAEIVKKM
ncbi:MAG: CoA pyrophosphatase [Lachnospiraceae bacterium]|nr:CoA pyrophosphatase [Lachnospiraceae bacterium]